MAYIGKSPTVGVRNRYYFTATGGETSLSGSDDNGNTFNFRDGAYVDVSLNGVKLVAGDDYNTTTANTISGLAALGSGDIVEAVVYDIFTVSDTVSKRYGGEYNDTVRFENGLIADSASITRISSDLIPVADSAYDLGTPSLKWKDLYLSGSSIFLGDVTLKDVGGSLAVQDASGNSVNLNASSVLADSATIGELTVSGNLTVQGTTTTIDNATAQNVNLGDNDKIQLGDSNDLQIYHDGSHSVIKDNGTGNLRIFAENFQLYSNADNATMMRGLHDGAVELYYDGAEKFSTTNTGIDVTGTAVTDGLTVSADANLHGLTAGRGAGDLLTNTVLGSQALCSNTTGNCNVALGSLALDANTTGSKNVAVGRASMSTNEEGSCNTAVGVVALSANVSGDNNVAVGASALQSNTTASNNTAVGYQALYDFAGSGNSYNTAIGWSSMANTTTGVENTSVGYNMITNTTGSYNTALGHNALHSNTTASNNTAVGYQAAYSNTTGTRNTFLGHSAGYTNTTNSYQTYVGYNSGFYATGNFNTAVGDRALEGASAGSTGDWNIAIGHAALVSNTTGSCNVAIGIATLDTNLSGSYNVGIGSRALDCNTTGCCNTAVGFRALQNNTGSTHFNTAIGTQALYINSTGGYNTALGFNSIPNNTTGSFNVGLGAQSLLCNTTGENNIGIGVNALFYNTTGSRNIAIGRNAVNENTGNDNIGIGHLALCKNSTGTQNNAIGSNALDANTIGGNNQAMGKDALGANICGNDNIAIGTRAMAGNTSGCYNTGIGFEALCKNTTGANNVAIGWRALLCNSTSSGNTMIGFRAGCATTSSSNTIVGSEAGANNTSGDHNTIIGHVAGAANTSASYNVALGSTALRLNTTGNRNTAIGYKAMCCNTGGSSNIAIGFNTAPNLTSSYNTIVGEEAAVSLGSGCRNAHFGHYAGNLASGCNNTYIGTNAGWCMTSGSNNTILGRFNGNENGLDIRTSSNNIVLSDGSGNPRARWVDNRQYNTRTFVSCNTGTSGYGGDDDAGVAFRCDWNSWATIFEDAWIGNTSGWGTFWAGSACSCYRRTSGDTNPNEYVMVGNGQKRFTFDLDAGGNAYFDGSLSQNAYDYAEYFEWQDGNPENEDRRGYTVILTDDGKIREAISTDNSEDIFGVVTGTAAILGDAAMYDWSEKYLTDEWGTIMTEEVYQVSWSYFDESGEKIRHSYDEDRIPEGLTVPEDASRRLHNRRLINPNYDPDQEYVPRDMRKEWDPIGILGKVRIKDGQVKNPRWKLIKIVNGKELWLIR